MPKMGHLLGKRLAIRSGPRLTSDGTVGRATLEKVCPVELDGLSWARGTCHGTEKPADRPAAALSPSCVLLPYMGGWEDGWL